MPHIVFNERVDLEKIQERFKPMIEKDDNLIKIKEVYVSSAKNNALFHAITIGEINQEFFIEVLTGDCKTTVRLFPLTDPKKTDSVKKSLVIVSRFIVTQHPSLKITKTNLQEYLSGAPLH